LDIGNYICYNNGTNKIYAQIINIDRENQTIVLNTTLDKTTPLSLASI
jgi:hypothetical protein